MSKEELANNELPDEPFHQDFQALIEKATDGKYGCVIIGFPIKGKGNGQVLHNVSDDAMAFILTDILKNNFPHIAKVELVNKGGQG